MSTALLPAVTDTLVVSEVFGPTIQGEGPHAGQAVGFVRLGGCNLTCSWCDTAYTWDASRYDLRQELQRVRVASVFERVSAMPVSRVVFSGGEPLLQDGPKRGLLALAHRLARADIQLDVETNGTRVPSSELAQLIDLFVVSPKLAHAGVEKAIVPAALSAFADLADLGQAVLKVVCRSRADVTEAIALADAFEFPLSKLWVMPEGTDAQTISARSGELAEAALEAGVNFTTRLHVLLWGSERGR